MKLKKNNKEKINSKNVGRNKKYKSYQNNGTNKIILNTNYNNQKGIDSLNNSDNKNQKYKKFKPDTDYELNWLTYRKAIKFDKRTSCEYYCALIRTKQIFLFTFCSFNDYNSGIIKKFILFLSFALHYTINALFFTDSTLHQIYKDEGKFNIGYQIPKIIYSAIISTALLRLMLHFLILTDKNILEVKNQQNKMLALIKKKKILKCIKIKYIIFFVLNFSILVLFWYYLTCFNAVYENTQIYLIENTLISFGISLFYPFIINIFPTFIRMGSIHSKNKGQSYCYKVSQIIQII